MGVQKPSSVLSGQSLSFRKSDAWRVDVRGWQKLKARQSWSRKVGMERERVRGKNLHPK